MKGQISRDSYRPDERYAGVFHIQGGMVTDADLDERTRIVTARTDLLGDDTIKDGVPATGGAVAVDAAGNVSLREGVIYADGVRGMLTAAPGANLAAPLALFTAQADLPLGPELPAADSIVYADIWERAVFSLEDPYLADVGLHGAETAFRTRTMVQLKAAPLAAAPDIEAGTGDFPLIGTAELAVAPTDPGAIVDECDPCAGLVELEQAVANALWRLEVVAVEGTPTAPTRVALAWSIENAAAIAPADVNHEDFERAGKVYEFFSPTTESYSGVFANSANAKPSAFVDDMATAPTPATDHGGGDWPFVRRWDGYAAIAGGAVDSQLGVGFTIAVAGSVVTLTLDTFTATLDLVGKAVMAGDYWLVELRRFAAEPERIRLVSATPVGIEHHYAILFRTNAAGAALPATDAERRKLTFPTLSDLPADHVGFVNNCPKLYDDAENVQEALDNLCSISAEDIAFDPDTCPVLYNGATNVQDALANLCKVDFSIDRVLRLLMDWGVVCGLVPRLEKPGTGLVTVTPGSFLDRAGNLWEFKGGDIDLDKLKFGESILYKDEGALAEAFKKETVCLALAAGEGGDVGVFVADSSVGFGPADPGFLERFQTCVEANKPLGLKDRYAALAESDQKTASRMMYVVSNSGSFFASSKLTAQEAQQARTFNEGLLADFSKIAPEQDTAALKDKWARIDQEVRLDDVRGSALEVRRMQRESLKLAALLESDEERMRRCLCDAIFPTCPPPIGKPPYLVPIACLHGFWEGHFIVTDVCPYCCRKQAITWRTINYFIGSWRTRFSQTLERLCCGTRDPDKPPGVGIDPKFTYNPDLYAQPTFATLARNFGLIDSIVETPPRPVTDIKVTVPVNDLVVDEAKTAMAGNGIEVVEVIDLNDAAAFDKIAGLTVDMAGPDRLTDKNAVRPGDKVVLIVQDGVARDYVPVERGTGKYLFETGKTTIVNEADLKRVAELTAAADAARTEIGALEGQREALTKDLTALRADVETLAKTREETSAAIVSTSEVLKSLIDEERLATERIAAANKELATAEATHTRIVTSLRGNQPATMLTGDRPDLAPRLAAQGIFTVSDLAGLSTTKIRELTAAGILDRDSAATLKKTAETFLSKPIE